MATFLFKAVALLVLQSPQQDLWARVNADSTDGPAWLELGRAYLQRAADYHTHRKPVTVDTVWAHANLDTAQSAFERAARWSAGTRTADSARVYRVYAFGEWAYVDWEAAGSAAATLTWHSLPEGLRLRPDLMIVPYNRWYADSVLRNRLLREMKTRNPSLRALSQSRAVCASMGFERPPDERAVKWNKRPLVWVTGKETKADRVPAQDFVFAALKLAVDEHETWTAPVTVLYRRAAANVGALCKAFETFGLSSEVGCH